MTNLKILAAALMLLCVSSIGCAHSGRGHLGVEGGFRFQLMHNDMPAGHERLVSQMVNGHHLEDGPDETSF